MRRDKSSDEDRFEQVIRSMVLGLIFCSAGATAMAEQPTAQAPPSVQNHAAAPAAPGDQQGPEAVRLVVGHSLLVRTPSKIKRILAGNPAVLDTVVTSPNEVVLTAKTVGGSSLVIWDESGQSRMMDVSADLDVSSLRKCARRAYPVAAWRLSPKRKVVLEAPCPLTAAPIKWLRWPRTSPKMS